jgi:hypothetical protein
MKTRSLLPLFAAAMLAKKFIIRVRQARWV